MIKLSSQESLGVGETFEDRCRSLADLGFQAIEIWGRDLIGKPENVDKFGEILDRIGLKVSVILVGYRGSLLAHNRDDRENAFNDIIELLKIAGTLQAIGLIVVPIFGPPQLPDLLPLMDTIELEDKLLIKYLKELGPIAKENNTNIILEPLNRGETHYLNTIEHAVKLIKSADVDGIMTMGDTFHMNIEERNMYQSVKEHSKYIAHIHLADNTRLEPGTGTIDFKRLFDVLKEGNYPNYVSLECRFSIEDRGRALAKTVEFLKLVV